MEAVRERIERGGLIRIPLQLMEVLGLSEGDEVDLRAEMAKLVVVPVTGRKRMRLNAEIVDELIEHEEHYEPELL